LGDIVTVTKIVTNIQKKRAKYLELEGRSAMAQAIAGDDEELELNGEEVADLNDESDEHEIVEEA
jgi:hypothetical protein